MNCNTTHYRANSSSVPGDPTGSKVYFRTVSSADGYAPVFGATSPAYCIQPGPELGVFVDGQSDSDPVGRSVHVNESVTYKFSVTNQTGDTAAGPVTLTIPIPPHTTYTSSTNTNGVAAVEKKDRHGRTTSVTYTYPTLAKGGVLGVDSVVVKVDDGDAFTAEQKDHPAGLGYDVTLSKVALAAPSQGVTSGAIVYQQTNQTPAGDIIPDFETTIIGSYKVSLDRSNNTIDRGGTVTFTLNFENDSAIPVTNAVAVVNIPAGTFIDTLYEFDNNTGNADFHSATKDARWDTNPAIVYVRGHVDIDKSAFPSSELGLITPILNLNPGRLVDLSNLSFGSVKILADDQVIVPSAVRWTFPSIPGGGAIRSASLTVRLPYDAPLIDPATGKPARVTVSSYDFLVPGTKGLASAFDNPTPDTVGVSVTNAVPTALPHLVLSKSVRGDLNLSNPNFHGSGFSVYPDIGNVTTVVYNPTQSHGVDYQLTYRNDLDANSQGADAHGTILHDEIPDGMTLCGFFKQVIGNPQNKGTLTPGARYYLANYVEGDDFSDVATNVSPNVDVNNSGVTFTATGSTPADWTHLSTIWPAPVPITSAQFTFYDAKGTVIPSIDPNTNQQNMAKVKSMDIRLGPVNNISKLTKGTSGFIQYTCAPIVPPSKVFTYPGYDFAITAGMIHSFGGVSFPASSRMRGFYIQSADFLNAVSGYPMDCLVRVVADVSFADVTSAISVNDTHPFDIMPYDFPSINNGDVSAKNVLLSFDVPKGVTFLNGQVFPQEGAVVTLDANTHKVTPHNNGIAEDCRPVIQGPGLLLRITPDTQTDTPAGKHVTLDLGEIAGHQQFKVRAFFMINGPGPEPDPNIAGGWKPANIALDGHYTAPAAQLHSHGGRRLVDTPIAKAVGVNTPTQQVHGLNPPRLGIHRNAPAHVPRGSSFDFDFVVANTGDSAATNVTIGMQVPFRTVFNNTSNGLLVVTSDSGTASTENPNAYTTTPRTNKGVIHDSGDSYDKVFWHFDSIPAKATAVLKLTLTCFPTFGNCAIQDHSAFVSSKETGAFEIAADPRTVWIYDGLLDDTKIQAAQAFFEAKGLKLTPEITDAIGVLAKSLTTKSQISELARLDSFQLAASLTSIIPLGKGQVMVVGSLAAPVVASGGGNVYPLPGGQSLVVASGGGNVVSQGGGNVVSQGGGNVVSQGGGNVVATGGGNFISIAGGVAGLAGTQTCSALLANIPAVVAAGGGNVVAAGGGNLLTSDGAGLLSNAPGGGIIGPINITAASVISANDGHVVSQGGGNVVAAGGGNVVSQGGGNVVSQGGGNVVSQGSGNVIASGGGNAIGNNGSSLTGN